jgi:hypothetical protein
VLISTGGLVSADPAGVVVPERSKKCEVVALAAYFMREMCEGISAAVGDGYACAESIPSPEGGAGECTESSPAEEFIET